MINNLLKKIQENDANIDSKLIEKAYLFASKAHNGQTRFSGEPYISHPVKVAEILADWKLDAPSLIAGLLHDTMEDAGIPYKELKENFGETAAGLVNGVSKVGRVRLRGSTEERFVEGFRKMLLFMARDLRVVLVKLADRYHNMETLKFVPKEKQKRIAQETLEVYAPLAERLGMGEVKGQLEDMAFPYVTPENYQWVKEYSAPFYKEAEKHVEEARRKILEALAAESLKGGVNGRAKHLYSLYKKLQRPEINKDIGKIYDIVALRIIVETLSECYAVLGIVHKIYKPAPSLGVSDYIAVPKPNGYRSIHTRVFGPGGRIIEVQIRTKEMHEEAEFGIAAHLHYAEKKASGAKDEILEKGVFAPMEKMRWIKQLSGWQREIKDSEEFIEAVKFDALSHRIFIFTPQGDVHDLPLGATPIDFAYAVHTDLGDRAMGAKINGKMTGLNYKLNSGDICEILVSKNSKKPSQDWLNFVVTRMAKNKIVKHYKQA